MSYVHTLGRLLLNIFLHAMDLAEVSEIIAILCDLDTLHMFRSADGLCCCGDRIGNDMNVVPLASDHAYNTRDHCRDNNAFHGILPDRRPHG